jgi:hypothetical protein
MKQIYFITGARGIGKSTTAARFARPSEIDQMVVVDCEDSMNDIVESNKRMGVKFGAFIRAYEQLGNEEERKALLSNIAKGTLPWISERQKSSLVAFWDWLVRRLDEVITTNSDFKFLVIDPVAPIEAALAAWAEANKKKSGWRTRAYGKSEIEAVRPLLRNLLEAVHARGIDTILLTSHLKNPWVEYAPGEAKPVLDKVIPSGRLKVWSRLTTAMIWLVPPYPVNANDAPSAIRMKARVGLEKVDKATDEWDIRRPIPPRIPAFSWKAWREYQKNGWDPLNPKEGETLLPHEKTMLDELLSDRQYELMLAFAAVAAEGDKEPSPVLNMVKGPEITEQEKFIIAMLEQGISETEIAEKTGIIMPLIVTAVRKHYRTRSG